MPFAESPVLLDQHPEASALGLNHVGIQTTTWPTASPRTDLREDGLHPPGDPRSTQPELWSDGQTVAEVVAAAARCAVDRETRRARQVVAA